MHSSDRIVARERERFLSTGTSREGVRAEILLSWLRSTRCAVDPESVDPAYEPGADIENRLTRAAIAVLAEVDEQLGELGIGFILTDAEARILHVRVRDRALHRQLEKIRAVPGFVFSEGTVGTTGLGTPIELGRPTRVDGHEHFSSSFVGYTCVGVPIRDPFGLHRPVGVLDVTCQADPGNHAISLVAAQTARSVEARLLDHYSAAERALLGRFLSATKRSQAAVVVVGRRIVLKSPRAARLLDGVDQSLIWDHASEVMSSTSDEVAEQLELGSGQIATTRTVPVREGGETLGVLIEFRAPAARRTRRPDGPSLAPLPESLRRSHPAIGDGYRAGRAVLGRRPIVITGEPGVGKATLGRALLAGHGAVHGIDAGQVTPATEAAWIAELTPTIRADGDPVLVRHLDHVSPAGRHAVVEVLGQAARRGTPVVVTQTCRGPDDEAALAGLDLEIVRVPPLRHRMSELPALVASFAEPVRVSSEVVQLLLRLPWLGNISALRVAVARLTAHVPRGGTVGLGQVPAEILRAAPRRTLTRFEQAEIHAICEALVEAGGNKRDAAELLGISRSTLYRKMQACGLDLDNMM